MCNMLLMMRCFAGAIDAGLAGARSVLPGSTDACGCEHAEHAGEMNAASMSGSETHLYLGWAVQRLCMR